MNYQETLQFLYSQVPVFEHIGSNAYKPGLGNINAMDEYFDHPHKAFSTIHVAGTNGKGSVSHTLAAVLQLAGYKVGLFTSPHLLDFDERIRVNGQPISHDYVCRWVEEHYHALEPIRPSFFELATMMGFCYFAQQKVDVAIIEVGLGGRLDSTNIISPLLSIITNISFDHMQFLGDTLPLIAGEKAGIMKTGVPCVIGECNDPAVRDVFVTRATTVKAPLTFAETDPEVTEFASDGVLMHYTTRHFGTIEGELTGLCQPKNTNTILTALHLLEKRLPFSAENVAQGFRHVTTLTGLMGRWQKISDRPCIYTDTGHNEGCFQYIGKQLEQLIAQGYHLHIVFGMVKDKDIDAVLRHLPTEATYYITNANTQRSLSALDMQQKMEHYHFCGSTFDHVSFAIAAALTAVSHETSQNIIFVGGSNFVVAEAMAAVRSTLPGAFLYKPQRNFAINLHN